MTKRAFFTITLGCKLNQYDSAAIEGELLRRGFRPTEAASNADVVVVNTCTVTHRARSPSVNAHGMVGYSSDS